MTITQKIFLLLMLGSAAQAYAVANLEDSRRCTLQTITMTNAEDGCTGDYCERAAFVCVPAAWWTTAGGLQVPAGNAKAPLVLAFHGRDKQNPDSDGMTQGLWNIIKDAPEAGMFGRNVNLHGAMPSAIVIYFQGLPTKDDWTPDTQTTLPSENPAWRGWQVNPGAEPNTSRDIKFVNKFVSRLINDTNPLKNHIDMERIYAVGYSNGSRFVGVLWHDTSTSSPLQRSRLKAIAFTAAQAGDFPASSNPAAVVGDNLFDKSDKKTSIFMGMGINDHKVEFSLQQQSIQKAEDLLQINLATHDGLVEDIESVNPNDSAVHLRVAKHGLADGHAWPEGQENRIATFFNL